MAAVTNKLQDSEILCFGWQAYLEGIFKIPFNVECRFDAQTLYYFVRVRVQKEDLAEVTYVTQRIDERDVMAYGWMRIFPSDETIATIMLLIG